MDMRVKMGLAGPEDIQKEMEQFFIHLGRWKRPIFYFEKAWKPRCDVSETDTEIIVMAELAGVSADHLDIRVEGSNLIIRGARRQDAATQGANFAMMEISYGPFERVIPLPSGVDAEEANARFDEGFLEIRLPKRSISRSSREVDIDASGE